MSVETGSRRVQQLLRELEQLQRRLESESKGESRASDQLSQAHRWLASASAAFKASSSLGIDFVPNMYRLMAPKPAFLEANWQKVKAVMVEPGKLDRMAKAIFAVAGRLSSRAGREALVRVRLGQLRAVSMESVKRRPISYARLNP